MAKKTNKGKKRSSPKKQAGGKRSADGEMDRKTASEPLEGEDLQFEDPYEDEYAEEEVIMEEVGEETTNNMSNDNNELEPRARIWRAGVDPIGEDEELQFDPSAYVMYHVLRPEWPCLSFDFVRDELGGNRTRFPVTLYSVAGTQAANQTSNKLIVMKMSDLHRLPRNVDDEDAEAALDDEDDDEHLDDDPILDSVDIPHRGGVNRVRSCPLKPSLVAAMSETSEASIWDISDQLNALKGAPRPSQASPIFTFDGHRQEGYAVDWSRTTTGVLATGDCTGAIHVWNPDASASSWQVEAQPRRVHQDSVEDIQWSPSEGTVFMSCSADRTIRVWDIRERTRAMVAVNAHDTDVNVISWNPNVAYLLASGADDGSFKVWDLRNFKASEPIAHFQYHTQPITSLEWHPTDESVLCVSGDDHQATIWDMSVEEDEAAAAADQMPDVPPQLLFVHQGQKFIKEVHFHPQVTGVIMSTASDSFNIFKPSTNI